MSKFLIEVDGNELKEVAVEVPVEVTENAPEGIKRQYLAEGIVPRLEEPRLRVGMGLGDDDFMQFMSNEDDYVVYAGAERRHIAKNKIAILRYKDNQYSFDGKVLEFSSSQFIRLEPQSDPRAVLRF